MIFLSVFRSQKFKGLWLERIKKKHIHSPNLRNKSVFRDPIFFSVVVYTFISSHITFSILILTNLQKKKGKKKLTNWVCFPFFTEKLLPKFHPPGSLTSEWSELLPLWNIPSLRKYFSFVYWFLASADYDFFSHSQCISLKPVRHNKAKYCDCDTASVQNSNVNKIGIAA